MQQQPQYKSPYEMTPEELNQLPEHEKNQAIRARELAEAYLSLADSPHFDKLLAKFEALKEDVMRTIVDRQATPDIESMKWYQAEYAILNTLHLAIVGQVQAGKETKRQGEQNAKK